MTIELIKFMDGTRLIATSESPDHYGVPVVTHEGCLLCKLLKDTFDPCDPVPECLEPEKVREFFGATPCMADFVSRLCIKLQDWEIAFVNKWLVQKGKGINYRRAQ